MIFLYAVLQNLLGTKRFTYYEMTQLSTKGYITCDACSRANHGRNDVVRY